MQFLVPIATGARPRKYAVSGFSPSNNSSAGSLRRRHAAGGIFVASAGACRRSVLPVDIYRHLPRTRQLHQYGAYTSTVCRTLWSLEGQLMRIVEGLPEASVGPATVLVLRRIVGLG